MIQMERGPDAHVKVRVTSQNEFNAWSRDAAIAFYIVRFQLTDWCTKDLKRLLAYDTGIRS